MCCSIWQIVSTEDDFPEIKHDCLSIEHDSPSIRHDCRSISRDSPPIKHDGFSIQKLTRSFPYRGSPHMTTSAGDCSMTNLPCLAIENTWNTLKASYRSPLLRCMQDSISGHIYPVEWFPADCCQAGRDPHWQHQSSTRDNTANTAQLSSCLRGWYECKCLSSNTRGWCRRFCCCKHLCFRCGHALLLQASFDPPFKILDRQLLMTADLCMRFSCCKVVRHACQCSSCSCGFCWSRLWIIM